jgi:hypothetical protein
VQLAEPESAVDHVDSAAAVARPPATEQVDLAGLLDPGGAECGAAAAAPEQSDITLARVTAATVGGVERLQRRIGLDDRGAPGAAASPPWMQRRPRS